jgi:hypothetical protein
MPVAVNASLNIIEFMRGEKFYKHLKRKKAKHLMGHLAFVYVNTKFWLLNL